MQKTNKQHKLRDTRNSVVVSRGEGRDGGDEEGQGGQICHNGGRLDSGW